MDPDLSRLMSVLSDYKIKELAREGMIDPFIPYQILHVNKGNANLEWQTLSMPDGVVIPFGLTNHGYVVRCSNTFKIITAGVGHPVLDPKDYSQDNFHPLVSQPGKPIPIPPHTTVVTTTIEELSIPPNYIAQCSGIRPYARCGLIIQPQILGQRWQGRITIELFNSTNSPVLVHPGEGIAQVTFHGTDYPCGDHDSQDNRTTIEQLRNVFKGAKTSSFGRED